ncbi:hypothetical protein QV02_03095 [Gallibacterium anatis]|uniref:Lipoprotein n=1 Tax=Gallibacterium anatis TaxID=750 RepID=A0A1A7PA40_9PAST|nr:hypothetical protein QV02_03095 [Gallibacterium anatis]OBW98064.1 hypothetical protein QV03_07955 [Gallibacterium anatis]
MKKTAVALAVMMLLPACSKPAIYVTNSSCAGFSLIKASRNDTTETLRQIWVHNQTYRAICSKEAENGRNP